MSSKHPELKPSQHNPDELLGVFSKTQTAACAAFAIGIHVVIVLASSTSYIRDTYIDPDGALERKEQATNAEKANLKAKADAAEGRAKEQENQDKVKEEDTEKKPAKKDETETAATTDSEKTDKQMMEEKKDSQVIKEITEKAKPAEIPRDPDDLGINIDDTN